MAAIQYTPAGPILQAFHDDPSFVRGIMGPIGSGKSVGCCMELMILALAQKPGPDGISRTRAVIVRNTFPELKSTTIKTWLDWFPEKLFGKVRWDSPITHRLALSSRHELEAVFLALDRPDDVKKLLSLETTWIWLNEARELPKAVLDASTGRVGRYPSKRDGGPTRYGVLLDTNPPDDDHWWYKLAEVEKPEGFAFYQQPSGLSPQAENLDNLPDGYYLRLIPGKTSEWVKVYVEGRYGSVTDGKPVYPEFNDSLHVATFPLKPHAGLPLILGFDFGLTPACVVTQMTPRGQLRVLDEVVGFDMGLQQLIDTSVKPLLAQKYAGMKIITFHDPAGTARSQADEVTCRQVLKKSGLNPSTVSTNNFTARRESVAWFLSRLVDGDPALMISPNVHWLRKGMNGDYKFKRVNVPGEDRFKDEPDKNKSSHVCEALQYVALHHYTPGRTERRKQTNPYRTRYVPAQQAGY